MRRKDKVAATGGALGTGGTEARLFAKEGAAVVVADGLFFRVGRIRVRRSLPGPIGGAERTLASGTDEAHVAGRPATSFDAVAAAGYAGMQLSRG